MATTINAATTGLVETSDGTAVLDLQTGGTTALRVNATQAIGVGSTPSFGSAGQFLTSQGSAASPTWTTGGTGTVTSVGWTGGIVSIATATTTPAFTIAGTSGGIPYFSSGTTWASSAALTQYGIVYGGGAGAAPVATAAGTTGQFLGANTGGAPTWQTPAGGSPGGSNTYVQYNSSGSFAGSANLTFDGNNLTLNGALLGRGPGNVATNCVFGPSAFSSNTTGVENVVIGSFAANANTTGSQIIAIGTNALRLGTAATASVAIGLNSLFNGTGISNTAVGYGSAGNITSGANNTCLGRDSGTDAVRNITTGSNEIVMGNNSNTAAYIKVSWTVTSDARDKTSFAAVPHGLDFVNSLTPTAYKFRVSREDDTPTGPARYGFTAQNILAAEGDNPVIIDNSDPENLKYNADSMIAVLVNAIKELTTRIAALEAK